MQPGLARSISLQYPKSIAQVVSLAEMTKLVVKASKRLVGRANIRGGNSSKGPTEANRGQGRWRGNASCGRGLSGGGGRGGSWNRGRNSGGGKGQSSSSGFDPLACYRCGVHGHLARDYPFAGGSSMSGGSTDPTRGSSSKSGCTGPGRSRGRGRHVCFGGMNVLYDLKDYEYIVDDYRQIYVPLESEPADTVMIEEKKEKNTKTKKVLC